MDRGLLHCPVVPYARLPRLLHGFQPIEYDRTNEFSTLFGESFALSIPVAAEKGLRALGMGGQHRDAVVP